MTFEERIQLAQELHDKMLSVDELYEALNMILSGVTE